MYRISHSYLTFADDDAPVVETEEDAWDGNDPADLAAIVRAMIVHPGGRSGTTVALTITPTVPLAL
jgi:hypothetical protein